MDPWVAVVEIAALLYCVTTYTLAQRTKRQAAELLAGSSEHLQNARNHLFAAWRHDPDWAICELSDKRGALLLRRFVSHDVAVVYRVHSVHASLDLAMQAYNQATEHVTALKG